jgi:hypothetical protein
MVSFAWPPPPDVPMLLALDKDEGRVIALAAAADADAHCKAVDVRDGFWLFFDDDGSPLEARFEHPDLPALAAPVSHAYTLQRAMSGRWLQERIGQVRTVQGCGLSSVDDLVETLKVNRGKRVPPAPRR